jgi:hypothetical protein
LTTDLDPAGFIGVDEWGVELIGLKFHSGQAKKDAWDGKDNLAKVRKCPHNCGQIIGFPK